MAAAISTNGAGEPSPKLLKISHNEPLLKINNLSDKAVVPSRVSALSVGYNLSSAVETKVPARGKALVSTDLSIAIPEGTYARIVWREKLAPIKWSPKPPIPTATLHPHPTLLLRSAHLVMSAAISTNGAGEPSPKLPKLSHNEPLLKIKKLSDKAVVPSRASALSAGYDLSSAVETKVPARGKALVPTDLSIAIPEGTYARIAPRSGLAWKHSIGVGAGVIDADYRGPVGVVLFNHSDVDFEVKPGDRIAQMIIERIMTPDLIEVEDLDSTIRGVGGFGSTGV